MIVDASGTDDRTVDVHPESLLVDSAMQTAESVLTDRFGSSVGLVSLERLACSGPAVMVRARVASASFSLPRTLMIKHYPEAAGTGESDPFAREAAGYQLFTALPLEDRMCPELLAHDARQRVLVTDDLGSLPTLQDKLAGSDSRAAETALLSWARSLGKMHFSTVGREADFHALLRRLSSQTGGDDPTAGEEDREGSGWRYEDGGDAPEGIVPARVLTELPALLHADLGITTPDPVLRMIHRAAEQARSSDYRAYSRVDLRPENSLLTDEGVRFRDFERGRIRHALADAIHLRVPFATSPYPMALPSGTRESLVAAWRAEVVELWPALSDDAVLSTFLLGAQVMLVWMVTWKNLPELIGEHVAASGGRAAALVSWWRDLAQDAWANGEEAVAEHAEAVAGALDTRFGPGLQLALYPAFR